MQSEPVTFMFALSHVLTCRLTVHDDSAHFTLNVSMVRVCPVEREKQNFFFLQLYDERKLNKKEKKGEKCGAADVRNTIDCLFCCFIQFNIAAVSVRTTFLAAICKVLLQ